MLFFINFLPYDRHVPYLDIAFVNIEAYDLHYFVPLCTTCPGISKEKRTFLSVSAL